MNTLNKLDIICESYYNESMIAYYNCKNEYVYETYSSISNNFALEGGNSNNPLTKFLDWAVRTAKALGKWFLEQWAKIKKVLTSGKNKILGLVNRNKNIQKGKEECPVFSDDVELVFKDVETNDDIIVNLGNDADENKKELQKVEEIIKDSMEVLEESAASQSEVKAMLSEIDAAVDAEDVDKCKTEIDNLNEKKKDDQMATFNAMHNIQIASTVTNNIKNQNTSKYHKVKVIKYKTLYDTELMDYWNKNASKSLTLLKKDMIELFEDDHLASIHMAQVPLIDPILSVIKLPIDNDDPTEFINNIKTLRTNNVFNTVTEYIKSSNISNIDDIATFISTISDRVDDIIRIYSEFAKRLIYIRSWDVPDYISDDIEKINVNIRSFMKGFGDYGKLRSFCIESNFRK